jgi:hypothetical protein
MDCLKEMVMRIDEPREHDVPGEIDDFVGFTRQGGRMIDLFDPTVLNEHPAAGDLAPRSIHGRENVSVANKECTHILNYFAPGRTL